MRASLVSIPWLSEASGGERIGCLNFKVTKPSKETKGRKMISNRELDTCLQLGRSEPYPFRSMIVVEKLT